ncbi:class I SAM-dependent methyltransferase [Paenibacillus sp. NFR01]|uniref:class I SAM-dependent methyltransferase n=1 Tax=Paenibacillus sp. NFR01 TaxID=1566279 RepID=UPI0008D4582B|nr:class I SAM-dependent methyltransferase [Paenibacillus sp. NFR01]SEU28130.1 Methyltransferase domain-containing protein [Paenibacillus sp. NFR01]
MDLRLKFNEDARGYDRWRPTYTAELFQDILHYSGLKKDGHALEIGIGTGQATLPVLETGCRVTAVELGDSLAEFVRHKYAAYANLEVITGDFGSFAGEEAAFDLIYSATAFHWIPQEAGLAKVLGLLKPGGTLALFWNHPFVNREDDPAHRDIRLSYAKYKPVDVPPREFDGSACPAYAEQLEKAGFAEVASRLYYATRTLNADSYLALLNTYSDHRALPGPIREGLEGEIAGAIERNGGQLNIYDTMDLYLARKS